MATSSKQYADTFIRWTRIVTLQLLNDWPADKWTFQQTPEDNHALWVMGHLAMTDAWLAGEIGITGVSVPESYHKLFGMGSKPGASATDYPSAAEVRGVFSECRGATLAWLESATPEQLSVSLKEKSGGFADDVLDAFLKMAWHEGWHCGQLGTLRRALGLKSIF